MTEHLEFEADLEDPMRLDAYLAGELEDLSRSRINALCKEGRVLVNGRGRKPSFHLGGGEHIVVEIESRAAETAIIPEDLPLDVVHEDDSIIVINKQPGMVVHPGAGISSGTLVHALAFHFQSLSQIGGSMRPGIVHRLDKGTSGLILAAKTDAAHRHLSQQWQDGTVTKVYQALVWGIIDPPTGELETHIGRHPRLRHTMAAEVAGGKWSQSRYKVVTAFIEASLVNVHILTGRTHQVRVHMAHLGHPVVGDALYGRQRHRHLAKAFEEMPERPMLHAALLRFRHPDTEQEMTFKLDPPTDFARCAKRLATWPNV